tara:strand:- start:1115 stop:3589 length:2475 start_codon:yes stop_codon:yes gene_type:complete
MKKNTYKKNVKALIDTIQNQDNYNLENYKSVIDKYLSIDKPVTLGADKMSLSLQLHVKITAIMYDFLSDALKKKEDSRIKIAIDAAIKIEDLETIIEFIKFLTKEDDEKNIQYLLEELKRQNFFQKVRRFDINYDRQFKNIVNYFTENNNSSMLELLNEFNDEYKWFDFSDLRIDIARYYYDQDDFASSLKYVLNILKRDPWIGSEKFLVLIMQFYRHQRDRDILHESYRYIKKSIKKSDKWDIYELLRGILNVSRDPYVYNINDEKLLHEILGIAFNQLQNQSSNAKEYFDDPPKVIKEDVSKSEVEEVKTHIGMHEIESSMYLILKKACGKDTSAKDIIDTTTTFITKLGHSWHPTLVANANTGSEDLGRIKIFDDYDDINDIPPSVAMSTEDVLQIIFILFDMNNDISNNILKEIANTERLKFALEKLSENTDMYDQAENDFDLGPYLKSFEKEINDNIRLIKKILGKIYIDKKTSTSIIDESNKIFVIHLHRKASFDPQNPQSYDVSDLLKIATNLRELKSSVDDYKSRLKNLNFNHDILIQRVLSKLIPFYTDKLGKEKDRERDKVLADVSHRMKGLIHSIQTPLDNMLESTIEDKQQIKNAIKGTALISDLVNMASHSYSASIDDFYYDARNNKGGITLETILVDSIKLAIPHMFDGKNYNKQNRNYFKTKEDHIEAKNEFQTKISDCNQIGIIKKYLNKYFFKIKIEIPGIKKHSIGFDRETPTKFKILYTELILNALKNVSYLDMNQREVSISIGLSDDLKFSISNSHNKMRKVKTTGLGKYFVEKMVEAINGKYVFNDNKIYTAEIILPNLWEKK